MPTLLEKKFASWEVVYVVFLRVIVFAFISIAVTVVAWFAYSQAKDSEMRTFLVEYEAVVETARQRLQEGVSSRLHAAEAASAVFSSVRGDLVIANFWVRVLSRSLDRCTYCRLSADRACVHFSRLSRTEPVENRFPCACTISVARSNLAPVSRDTGCLGGQLVTLRADSCVRSEPPVCVSSE